ncbi:TolC family protein [Persephonella sp.]
MRFFRLFVIGLLFIGFSRGETFQQVLDRALKESPYIKSLEKTRKVAAGEIKGAKLLPNPELSLTFGRLYSQTDSGVALTDFSISQPLMLWGTRKYAVEKAKVFQKYMDAYIETLKREFTGQLYIKFFTALYMLKSKEIAEKNLQISKNTFEFIKESYSLGEESRINFLRAKREYEKAKMEYQKASLEYEKALKELSATAGFDVSSVEGKLSRIPHLKDINPDEIPSIKALISQIEELDKNIRLQKALAKPQISVEFVGGEDPVDLGKYEFGIGISSTLPVFNRNQGEIIKSSAKKSALQQELIYRKKQISSRIASIKKAFQLYKKQLNTVENEILPQLEEGMKLAEESLSLREITPFEFYNWKREYIQTLLYRFELYYQIHSAYGEYIKIGGAQ